jgi:hypothetical protein
MVNTPDCASVDAIQLVGFGVAVICGIAYVINGYKAGKLPSGLAAWDRRNYTRRGCVLIVAAGVISVVSTFLPLMWPWFC